MAGDSTQAREHAREPIELEVAYQRLNAFFSDYTRNISKGGTFIATDKPLAVGTEFLFKFKVPALSEPLCITGQVQWVRTHADVEAGGDGEEPGMGIRFVYRDDDERAAIERQIEKIMVDSLGQRLYARLMEHSRAHESAAGAEAGDEQSDDPDHDRNR
ncbi:TIGR02266 family protein [Haliangium sp.]